MQQGRNQIVEITETTDDVLKNASVSSQVEREKLRYRMGLLADVISAWEVPKPMAKLIAEKVYNMTVAGEFAIAPSFGKRTPPLLDESPFFENYA